MIEAKHDLNEVLETAGEAALVQAARSAVWQFSATPYAPLSWALTAYVAAGCLDEIARRRELGEDTGPRPRVLPMPELPDSREGRSLLLAMCREILAVVIRGGEEAEILAEAAAIYRAAAEVLEMCCREADLDEAPVH